LRFVVLKVHSHRERKFFDDMLKLSKENVRSFHNSKIELKYSVSKEPIQLPEFVDPLEIPFCQKVEMKVDNKREMLPGPIREDKLKLKILRLRGMKFVVVSYNFNATTRKDLQTLITTFKD
jgi:hypothetical protein